MGGYVRAYVDRDALERADGEPGGPIPCCAATEGVKGDGIDLPMSGARLDRYRANPILGYGHRYYSRDDLPIGCGENVRVDGQRLMVDLQFDQSDEFARKCEEKMRRGYLNAVSIGFDVLGWRDGKGSYWSGGVAEAWELTEISVVPVPMDAEAVVAGGRALRGELLGALDLLGADVAPVDVEKDPTALARLVRVSEDLIRAADPVLLGLHIARAMRRAIETPDVEPELAGVTETAARDFLAALTR